MNRCIFHEVSCCLEIALLRRRGVAPHMLVITEASRLRRSLTIFSGVVSQKLLPRACFLPSMHGDFAIELSFRSVTVDCGPAPFNVPVIVAVFQRAAPVSSIEVSLYVAQSSIARNLSALAGYNSCPVVRADGVVSESLPGLVS